MSLPLCPSTLSYPYSHILYRQTANKTLVVMAKVVEQQAYGRGRVAQGAAVGGDRRDAMCVQCAQMNRSRMLVHVNMCAVRARCFRAKWKLHAGPNTCKATN